MIRLAAPALACAAICAATTPAFAASHLWRFNEIFSNDDGSVMFIELKESAGASGEIFLVNKWVRNDETGMQFTFPENLEGNTANRHLLLATQAFADLPGAPTPDYIINENFFDVGGGTLRYWNYGAAVWNYGLVPTDGLNALSLDGSIGVNSPTNYAGESGSVDVPGDECSADTNGDERVDVSDLVKVILEWGTDDPDADVDGSGNVDVADLVVVILAWGACP